MNIAKFLRKPLKNFCEWLLLRRVKNTLSLDWYTGSNSYKYCLTYKNHYITFETGCCKDYSWLMLTYLLFCGWNVPNLSLTHFRSMLPLYNFRSNLPVVLRKKGALRNFAQNSQENTCARDSFWIKLQTFSRIRTECVEICEFCEISINIIFYRTTPMAASVTLEIIRKTWIAVTDLKFLMISGGKEIN